MSQHAVPRSYLFVPGNRPERFAKALATDADVVILDLEDAVAASDKPAAREAVSRQLACATIADRARLVVRINDEATAWFNDDVAMLATAAAPGVMLSKAERVETIARLRAANPQFAILALIESALGVLHANALARAEGVTRLAFGTLDYANDLGLSGDPIGLDYAASRLAIASRAAGLPPPVAGVTPEINDDAPLLNDLRRARAHGFSAKLCIHPRQVAALHAALQPTAAEIAWARSVIEAMNAGRGSLQLEGRMIDRPVMARAQAILHRAAGASNAVS